MSDKPYLCEVKAGQRLLWCRCGKSTTQPFCDSQSHKGTGLLPLPVRIEKDDEVLFCGCKQTGTPPFCDGTHSNLPGGYQDAADMPDLPIITPDKEGYARLDGDSYVVTPRGQGIETLVSPAHGARYQSQFLLTGPTPVLMTSAGDVMLWIMTGKGRVVIGGRSFAIKSGCGVQVRRNEAFEIEGDLRVYASICPLAESFEILPAMLDNFDASIPERVSAIDENARKAMGPRYFQVLLDQRHGLDNMAQFIGHIPQSTASMHRHLYEEALIIVAGEGVIWNETRRARVKSGDVIFFPRKQLHSLQCVSPDGMDVVGVIHPGNNPGINYY